MASGWGGLNAIIEEARQRREEEAAAEERRRALEEQRARDQSAWLPPSWSPSPLPPREGGLSLKPARVGMDDLALDRVDTGAPSLYASDVSEPTVTAPRTPLTIQPQALSPELQQPAGRRTIPSGWGGLSGLGGITPPEPVIGQSQQEPTVPSGWGGVSGLSRATTLTPPGPETWAGTPQLIQPWQPPDWLAQGAAAVGRGVQALGAGAQAIGTSDVRLPGDLREGFSATQSFLNQPAAQYWQEAFRRDLTRAGETPGVIPNVQRVTKAPDWVQEVGQSIGLSPQQVDIGWKMLVPEAAVWGVMSSSPGKTAGAYAMTGVNWVFDQARTLASTPADELAQIVAGVPGTPGTPGTMLPPATGLLAMGRGVGGDLSKATGAIAQGMSLLAQPDGAMPALLMLLGGAAYGTGLFNPRIQKINFDREMSGYRAVMDWLNGLPSAERETAGLAMANMISGPNAVRQTAEALISKPQILVDLNAQAAAIQDGTAFRYQTDAEYEAAIDARRRETGQEARIVAEGRTGVGPSLPSLAPSSDALLNELVQERFDFNHRELALAQKGAEIERLEKLMPADIVEQYMDPISEILYGVIVDPWNLKIPGFLSKYSPTVAKIMGEADELFSAGPRQAVQNIEQAQQATGPVMEALRQGLVPEGDKLVKWNPYTWWRRTPWSKANLDANWLTDLSSFLFKDVTYKEDARTILHALNNNPELLIAGIAVRSPTAMEGIVRIPPSVIGNREVAQRLPILSMLPENWVEGLVSLQGEGVFIPKQLQAEVDTLFYEGAKRFHGLGLLVGAPVGTVDVRLRRLPDGTGIVEYVDEAGTVISGTEPMPFADADLQVTRLRAAAKQDKTLFQQIGSLPRRIAWFQRAVMSDNFLALSIRNIIRNSESAVAQAFGVDAYSWLSSDEIVREWAKDFGGLAPGERGLAMQTDYVRGAAGGLNQPSSGLYDAIAQFITKNPDNPVSRFMRGAYNLSYGKAEVPLGKGRSYGVSEEVNRFKVSFEAYRKSKRASLLSDGDQLVADLAALPNAPPPEWLRGLYNIYVEYGQKGTKQELFNALRDYVNGDASKVVTLKAMGIEPGIITNEGWEQLHDIFARIDSLSDDEYRQAIDILFEGENSSSWRSLTDYPPQRGVYEWSDVVNPTERGVLHGSLIQSAQLAGIDAAQAQAQADRVIEAIIQGERAGSSAFIQELSDLLPQATPEQARQLWGAAMDFAYDDYLARGVARTVSDTAANRALELNTSAGWIDKFNRTALAWEEYGTGLAQRGDEYRQTLLGIMNGQAYSPKESPWDAVRRWVTYDPVELEIARSIPLGKASLEAKAEWDRVIQANRAAVDHSVAYLFDAFRRYPTLASFDILNQALREVAEVGGVANAWVSARRAEAFAGTLDWTRFYQVRNQAWTQMVDDQVALNQAYARSIVALAVTEQAGDTIKWTDSGFMGGEFQLRFPNPDGTWTAKRLSDGQDMTFAAPGSGTAMPEVPQNVYDAYLQVAKGEQQVDQVMEDVARTVGPVEKYAPPAAPQVMPGSLEAPKTTPLVAKTGEVTAALPATSATAPTAQPLLRGNIPLDLYDRLRELDYPGAWIAAMTPEQALKASLLLETPLSVPTDIIPEAYPIAADVVSHQLWPWLRGLGYTPEQIASLTPTEAWDLIRTRRAEIPALSRVEDIGRIPLAELEGTAPLQRTAAEPVAVSPSRVDPAWTKKELVAEYGDTLRAQAEATRVVEEAIPGVPAGGVQGAAAKEPWQLTPEELARVDWETSGSGSRTPKRAFELRRNKGSDADDWESLYDFVTNHDQYDVDEVLGKNYDPKQYAEGRAILNKAKRNQPITVYRTAESEFDNGILPGAYVSESKSYALAHSEHVGMAKPKLFSVQVYPDELLTFGDAHEYLYIPRDPEIAQQRLVAWAEATRVVEEAPLDTLTFKQVYGEDSPYSSTVLRIIQEEVDKTVERRGLRANAPQVSDIRKRLIDDLYDNKKPVVWNRIRKELAREEAVREARLTVTPGAFMPDDEKLLARAGPPAQVDPTTLTKKAMLDQYGDTLRAEGLTDAQMGRMSKRELADRINAPKVDRAQAVKTGLRGGGPMTQAEAKDVANQIAQEWDRVAVGEHGLAGIDGMVLGYKRGGAFNMNLNRGEVTKFRDLYGNTIAGRQINDINDVAALLSEYDRAKSVAREARVTDAQAALFETMTGPEIVDAVADDLRMGGFDDAQLEALRQRPRKEIVDYLANFYYPDETGPVWRTYDFKVPSFLDMDPNDDRSLYEMLLDNLFRSRKSGGLKADEAGDVTRGLIRDKEAARTILLNELPNIRRGNIENTLTPAQRLRVWDLVRRYATQRYDETLGKAKYVANRVGEWVMLDMRTGNRFIDQGLRLFVPFHYFVSRMPSRLAMLAINNPAMLNIYYETQRPIDRYHRQNEMPVRFKGKIPTGIKTPMGELFIDNPFASILPYGTYVNPNPYLSPEDAAGPVERKLNSVTQWNPSGFMPLVQFGIAAGLDAYEPLPNGKKRTDEFELGDNIPLYRILGYGIQAATGNVAPGATKGLLRSGDQYDVNRANRTAASLGTERNIFSVVVQYAQQIITNRYNRDPEMTNVDERYYADARALAEESIRVAGLERLLSTGASLATSLPIYAYPPGEEQNRAAGRQYWGLGYDMNGNRLGGRTAQRQFMEQNPGLEGAWSAGDVAPGLTATLNATYDERSRQYELRKEAEQAAVNQLRDRNPNAPIREITAAKNEATATYDQRIDELTGQINDIKKRQGAVEPPRTAFRDPTSGMNPQERESAYVQGIVGNAWNLPGRPTRPDEATATPEEMQAYYQAYAEYATKQENYVVSALTQGPTTDYQRSQRGGNKGYTDVAAREIWWQAQNKNTSAWELRRREEEDRKWDAIDTATAVNLRDAKQRIPGGDRILQTYLNTPAGDERAALRDKDWRYAAVTTAAYNPDVWDAMISEFGLAKTQAYYMGRSAPKPEWPRPEGSRNATEEELQTYYTARDEYFVAHPHEEEIGLWLYGRLTYSDFNQTQGGPWRYENGQWEKAESLFPRFDQGAQYDKAMELFTPRIFDIEREFKQASVDGKWRQWRDSHKADYALLVGYQEWQKSLIEIPGTDKTAGPIVAQLPTTRWGVNPAEQIMTPVPQGMQPREVTSRTPGTNIPQGWGGISGMGRPAPQQTFIPTWGDALPPLGGQPPERPMGPVAPQLGMAGVNLPPETERTARQWAMQSESFQKSAAWEARRQAVYTEFGEDTGNLYDQYLALPKGDARSAFKADHPELRAVSLYTWNPDEYAYLTETYGKDGVMTWAMTPTWADTQQAKQARSDYYDAHPQAFEINAWLYGRPGDQGALGGEGDITDDETFTYNFGADYDTAKQMFGADIWTIVAGYKRGWDKQTKAAYFDQYPQLSAFFDWWYANLPDMGVTAAAGYGRAYYGGGGGGGDYVYEGGFDAYVDPRQMQSTLWYGPDRRQAYQPPRWYAPGWLGAARDIGPEPIRKWQPPRW